MTIEVYVLNLKIIDLLNESKGVFYYVLAIIYHNLELIYYIKLEFFNNFHFDFGYFDLNSILAYII